MKYVRQLIEVPPSTPLARPLRGIITPMVTPLLGRDELDTESLERLVEHLLPALVIFTVVSGIVFLFTGLYRGMWRYASMNDLLAIVKNGKFVKSGWPR